MIENGVLFSYGGITLARVIAGWLIGCGIGIPLGWIVGNSKVVERLINPYIDFFRFVPPIVWVTVIVIWFGFGEISRVLLVAYTAAFIVVISTIIGVHQVEEEKIRAAKSLGANEIQLFTHVKIPASIPHVYSGMLVALGGAFMTIVAAEMLTASSGIGYLIWTQRLYFRLDWVFAGILLLGFLGLLTDIAFKRIGRFALKKYNVK
ncbi:MAG: ABC transporter permease [Candidatus Hadarchaeaceae archaeon]